MPRYFILLLLTIFMPSITSLSLPNSSMLTPNTILPPPNALATCTPFTLFFPRPLYHDCATAINALSSSGVLGYFHIGETIDEWKLPMNKTTGTCKVSVELVPFWVVAAGSWKEIKGAVRRLGEQCRRSGGWGNVGDVTGGEIKTGMHERILVKMVRS